MARKYNYIRQKLVENDADIIGHIAYSLYKKDKMQYIRQWEDKHPNEELTEDILDSYHVSTSLSGPCEGYRQRAETVLISFLDASLNEITENVEGDAMLRHKEMIESAVASNIPKHPWWTAIAQGVLSSLFFTLISILIIYAYKTGFITFPFE